MRLSLAVSVCTLLSAVGCSSTSPAPVAPSAVAAADAGSPDASTAVQSQGRSSLPSIAGIAAANPDFTSLVAALQKAGLVETFDGARHYTVFAPTNAAFDAAAAALGIGGGGAGLVAALDAATLTSVLTYHVTRGDRNSTSVLSAATLTMLDGNTTTVTVSAGTAKIDNASIVATDVRASNGMVHVIDAVLLPPSLR